MREAFEIFDSERSGKIDYGQLKGIFRGLGFSDIKKAEVQRLARDYDVQETGMVEFDDYMDLSKLMSDPEV